MIGTLGGTALVNGYFNWFELLIWFSSWFICLNFSSYTPLTVTLRGTTGGGDFSYIYYRGHNAYLCAFKIVTGQMTGAGFCIVRIKSCAELIVASVDNIFGMLI